MPYSSTTCCSRAATNRTSGDPLSGAMKGGPIERSVPPSPRLLCAAGARLSLDCSFGRMVAGEFARVASRENSVWRDQWLSLAPHSGSGIRIPNLFRASDVPLYPERGGRPPTLRVVLVTLPSGTCEAYRSRVPWLHKRTMAL